MSNNSSKSKNYVLDSCDIEVFCIIQLEIGLFGFDIPKYLIAVLTVRTLVNVTNIFFFFSPFLNFERVKDKQLI